MHEYITIGTHRTHTHACIHLYVCMYVVLCVVCVLYVVVLFSVMFVCVCMWMYVAYTCTFFCISGPLQKSLAAKKFRVFCDHGTTWKKKSQHSLAEGGGCPLRIPSWYLPIEIHDLPGIWWVPLARTKPVMLAQMVWFYLLPFTSRVRSPTGNPSGIYILRYVHCPLSFFFVATFKKILIISSRQIFSEAAQ